MMRFIIIIIMAYLNMNARVTIGQVVFTSINSFRVEESVKEVSDKATVTLAKNYEKLAGKPALDYIRPGMPVRIECGYKGLYFTEYTGFVKPGISSEYPLVVECDELFPLRQNNHILSYQQVTLQQLLETVFPSYKIECPEVNLGRFAVNNNSSLEVLKYLKDNWGLFTRLNGTILHVGWPYDFNATTANHIYTIGSNVKDAKGLKYKIEEDFNTQVNVTIHTRDGKKRQIKSGSLDTDAKVLKIDRYNISDADAKEIADANVKQAVFLGYTGYVTGFCFPRTRAGDSITIVNNRMPEREGTYLIEKMVLEYEEAHITRTNHLSFKV